MNSNLVPAIKRLIMATETRMVLIERTCPQLREPEEARKLLPLVTEIQQTLDGIIAEIREQTGARFKEFSNAELSCLCHIWASIWTEDRECFVDSQAITKIAGKNRPEEIGSLVMGLIDGSSPLSKFINIRWHAEEDGLGVFRFKIIDPYQLNRFILSGTAAGKEG